MGLTKIFRGINLKTVSLPGSGTKGDLVFDGAGLKAHNGTEWKEVTLAGGVPFASYPEPWTTALGTGLLYGFRVTNTSFSQYGAPPPGNYNDTLPNFRSSFGSMFVALFNYVDPVGSPGANWHRWTNPSGVMWTIRNKGYEDAISSSWIFGDKVEIWRKTPTGVHELQQDFRKLSQEYTVLPETPETRIWQVSSAILAVYTNPAV